MVNKITSKVEFDEALAKQYTVIDCYADWCGPCKMMAPVLLEVSNELTKVSFYKLNVDELGELIPNINAIPCLVLYKDGVEQTRIVGYRDEDTLEDQIRKVFR